MDIFLFDVDGTLTEPRCKISDYTVLFLEQLRKKHKIGFVGGSDLSKQKEQMGEDVLNMFDYCFPENGLVSYHKGTLIEAMDIREYLGQETITKISKTVLDYLSKMDIPVMTGTFIELRTGMINVSPIGRNCTQKQREEFFEYDKKHHIREGLIQYLKDTIGYDLSYSIGGQISIDIVPVGWDKSYCLKFLDKFRNIYFFGDKTHKGGNDHEIFDSRRTIGFSVEGPKDTMRKVKLVLKDF